MSTNEHPLEGSNPALYRQMCEPHASEDAANEQMRGFFAEVAASRIRYRIADVAVGVSVVVTMEGVPRRVMAGYDLGRAICSDAIKMHLVQPALAESVVSLMNAAVKNPISGEPGSDSA